MHRDTSLAMWYRRIDPTCYAVPALSSNGQEAALPTSSSWTSVLQRWLPGAARQSTPDDWRPLAQERRWSVEAAADRL
jgi:hypothetical protein